LTSATVLLLVVLLVLLLLVQIRCCNQHSSFKLKVDVESPTLL
jgi:hypothetical protein